MPIAVRSMAVLTSRARTIFTGTRPASVYMRSMVPPSTPEDAGLYFTLGMCYAADLETAQYDVTIKPLCVQDKDEISIYFVLGHHLD